MDLPASVPALHRDFIVRAVDVLSADERVIGIAAGGSFIGGMMDEQSDVDLLIAVSDRDLRTDTAARMEIAGRLGNLLTAFVGTHVHDHRLLICLYGPPPLKADLKFIVADDLENRVENPVPLYDPTGFIATAIQHGQPGYPAPNRQWIEDAIWVWIQTSAAKIRRGELFDARCVLNFIIERVLGPYIQIESGHQPSGVRRIEFIDPDRAAALAELCVKQDRLALKEAFQKAAALYLSLRKDVEPRTRAQQHALLYLDES